MTNASTAAALQAEVERAARLEAMINASDAALQAEVERAARLSDDQRSEAALQAEAERAARLEATTNASTPPPLSKQRSSVPRALSSRPGRRQTERARAQASSNTSWHRVRRTRTAFHG